MICDLWEHFITIKTHAVLFVTKYSMGFYCCLHFNDLLHIIFPFIFLTVWFYIERVRLLLNESNHESASMFLRYQSEVHYPTDEFLLSIYRRRPYVKFMVTLSWGIVCFVPCWPGCLVQYINPHCLDDIIAYYSLLHTGSTDVMERVVWWFSES